MQTDYFVIMRAGPSSYPLLDWDEYRVGFLRPAPVDATVPIQLRLGRPVPRAPVMVDYHSLPEPVVSERLKDALAALDLFGLQFVPADVKVKPDDVRRYWLLHVFNWIACIDRQRSALSFYRDGDVLGINKLVLDEKVLRRFPWSGGASSVWTNPSPRTCSTSPWWNRCWHSNPRACASSAWTNGTTPPASSRDSGLPRSWERHAAQRHRTRPARLP